MEWKDVTEPPRLVYWKYNSSTNYTTLPQEFTSDFYSAIKFRNYINFTINTVTTIIASLIIVYRSTKAMKIYRWFLLNIAIWSYLWDLNMNILFIPYFLFPSPSVCSLGLGNTLFPNHPLAIVIPFVFFLITLSACGVALANALYYRYKLFSDASTEMFTKRYFLVGMFLFHVFSSFPILIASVSSFFEALDWRAWFAYIGTIYPHTRQITDFCALSHTMFDTHVCSCGGIILGTTGTNILLATIVTYLIAYFFLISLGPLYIYHCLRKRAQNITQKKYDHEKKVILSLAMQAIIPLGCLVMPYIFALIEILFEIDIPTLLTAFIQLSTLHSFLNAITMILVLKPYRDAIKNVLLFKFSQKRVASNNAPPPQIPIENLEQRRLSLNPNGRSNLQPSIPIGNMQLRRQSWQM